MRAVQSGEPQGQRYTAEEIEVLRSDLEPPKAHSPNLPSGLLCSLAVLRNALLHHQEYVYNQQHRLRALHECGPERAICFSCAFLVSLFIHLLVLRSRLHPFRTYLPFCVLETVVNCQDPVISLRVDKDNQYCFFFRIIKDSVLLLCYQGQVGEAGSVPQAESCVLALGQTG